MTHGQFESGLVTALQALYDAGEAATIADWVMEEFTGYNRWQRKQKATNEIGTATLAKLKEAEGQLLLNKPVQYVLGYCFFYGLKFLVNEAVLIPRPETEELVEWVVNYYQNTIQPLQLLDIGTGSGCISIAIKKKMPTAIITSIDISKEALHLAEQNAGINGTELQLNQLDFLNEKCWQQLRKYDIIVSNPPYIPQQEKAGLNKNVIAWEPELALFVADDDPLIFYRKIVAFSKKHLAKGGAVFMETHQHYATAVQQLFTYYGYVTELKQDLNGNDRMVKAICK